MLDIAVFGSGRGSNFQALLNQIQQGLIPGARICVVISNNSKSGILEIARANGIPAMHISERQFPDQKAFVSALHVALLRFNVNFIVLAGYMKRMPSSVIALFRNRAINIHPALLPKFGGQGMYGIHVHEAVLAAGEEESGATVHMVDEEYDHGLIVLQKRVPVLPDDTAESLANRVLTVEHEILPEAVRMFVEGRVPVMSVEPAHA